MCSSNCSAQQIMMMMPGIHLTPDASSAQHYRMREPETSTKGFQFAAEKARARNV